MTENGARGFEKPVGNEQSAVVIWTGFLELHEKHAAEIIRSPRQMPCQISSRVINDELEVTGKGWPPKLAMQFIPKAVVGLLGHNYFENAHNVLFSFQTCDAFTHVQQTMATGGLAGCVHFAGVNTPANCLIKVLLLLFSKERQAFIGFIPTDQENFIVRLREIIQQNKRQVEMQRAERAKGVTIRAGPQFSPIGISAAGGIIQEEIMTDNPNIHQQQQQQQQIHNGGGLDANMAESHQPQQQQAQMPRNYGSLAFLIPSSTSSFSPFSPFSNYEQVPRRNPSAAAASGSNATNSAQPNNNSTTTTEMDVGNTETDIKVFISNLLTQYEQKNAARHLEVMNSVKSFRDIVITLTQLADRQRDTIHCLTIENERLRARLYGNNNNNFSSPSTNNNNHNVFHTPSSRLNPTGQPNAQQREQNQAPNNRVLDDLLHNDT